MCYECPICLLRNLPVVFRSFFWAPCFPLAHPNGALVLNESLFHCNPESKDAFSTDTLSVWPQSWRDSRADVACECLWSDQLFESSSTYLKSLGCLVIFFSLGQRILKRLSLCRGTVLKERWWELIRVEQLTCRSWNQMKALFGLCSSLLLLWGKELWSLVTLMQVRVAAVVATGRHWVRDESFLDVFTGDHFVELIINVTK